MLNIIRDVSLKDDPRHLGVLDVRYPEPDKWDIEGFRAYRNEALDRIRADGGSYSRDTVFRGTPYFRYFRRFGQTYPVMKQLESFLKGRPFPEEQYVNAVAFLTELKTHALYLIFGNDEMSDEAIDEVAEEIKSAVLALSPEAGIEYAII